MRDRPRNLEEGREILSSLPYLDKRVGNFQEHLEAEPCTNNEHCQFHSNSRLMCPACRLRLRFFHTIYNAEAYDPSLGQEDS